MEIETAAGMDAADVALLVHLATVHAALGRLRRAADLAGLALWIDPKSPSALEIAAVVALREGRSDDAVALVARHAAEGWKPSPALAIVARRARAAAG